LQRLNLASAQDGGVGIEQTIAHYGGLFYLVTLVWTALEGETFVLLAGYASARGLLNLPLLVMCAWIGSFCGDQFYFFLGRRFGTRVLRRFPRWQPGVDRALRLLERYDTGFILSFRFIYGVRNFSSFAMGMSPLRWSRFLVLNFIAAGLWAITFAGGGYMFGEALSAVLGDAAEIMGLVALVVFVVVVTYLLRRQKRGSGAITPALPADNDDDAPSGVDGSQPPRQNYRR
jgi:membrane protein DedA with SNARE-associated domain